MSDFARIAIFALVTGCGSSALHIEGAPPASEYVQSFDGEGSNAELGAVRLRPDVCKGIDTKPAGHALDESDFIEFVKTQNIETKVVRARSDLVFVDATNVGTETPVRFRVAILGTPGAAGHELHNALLQQGGGSWGLHRSNLAVLAPAASADDAVVIAGKLHLACWGTLMIAGHDDTFVVPGGYTEL